MPHKTETLYDELFANEKKDPLTEIVFNAKNITVTSDMGTKWLQFSDGKIRRISVEEGRWQINPDLKWRRFY